VSISSKQDTYFRIHPIFGKRLYTVTFIKKRNVSFEKPFLAQYILFSCTKHDKKINFGLFWIQRVQIVISCYVYFQRNTRNTESGFWYKSVCSMYFSTLLQKLGFEYSSILIVSEITSKPITISTCWIKKV
jgi:hypothetical protein